MQVYVPCGWTPYEGQRYYGVFSIKEFAQDILEKEKKNNYYEAYEILELTLDVPETF